MRKRFLALLLSLALALGLLPLSAAALPADDSAYQLYLAAEERTLAIDALRIKTTSSSSMTMTPTDIAKTTMGELADELNSYMSGSSASDVILTSLPGGGDYIFDKSEGINIHNSAPYLSFSECFGDYIFSTYVLPEPLIYVIPYDTADYFDSPANDFPATEIEGFIKSSSVEALNGKTVLRFVIDKEAVASISKLDVYAVYIYYLSYLGTSTINRSDIALTVTLDENGYIESTVSKAVMTVDNPYFRAVANSEVTANLSAYTGENPAPDLAKMFPGAADWALVELYAAKFQNLLPDALASDYGSSITRGEFCALVSALIEASGIRPDSMEQYISFSDTTDPEIISIAAYGIINGYPDGTFRPNSPISREEAAVMLHRTAAVLHDGHIRYETLSFIDSNSFSDWSADSIAFVSSCSAGKRRVMGGVGNNRFDPKGIYTRQQAILTFSRLLIYLDKFIY